MRDKRRTSACLAIVVLVSLSFGLFFATPQAFADSAAYFYDDLGRLTRVVKGTQGAIYRYDSRGNLLSVTSASTANASPVINSITPNVLFVGSELPVTISGQNFLTTESVMAVGGLVAIKNISATDTEITADMTALSAGVDAIMVTTDYGSPKTAEVSVGTKPAQA
jgi:YD repeat-containing protein